MYAGIQMAPHSTAVPLMDTLWSGMLPHHKLESESCACRDNKNINNTENNNIAVGYPAAQFTQLHRAKALSIPEQNPS